MSRAGLVALLAMPALAAPIAGNIKIDHFGYRTGDGKVAYLTANPGGAVEVHDAATNAMVFSVSNAADRGPDTSSPLIYGDHVWQVDFSAFKTPGRYYLLAPGLTEQSYAFRIDDAVYAAPMGATLKALYYQRCGTAKPAAYAGVWSDSAACHLQDRMAQPAPGCTFPHAYGTLDLSGGWHDAGDYNKYIGATPSGSCDAWSGDNGHTLQFLLDAYEGNPANFPDGASNIPESGNGIPDILDEAKWELDWYLKMQMTDKHVLSVVHQTVYTTGSPPSTDTTQRYYYPPNPDGEAQFVALLAHASRVMSGVTGLGAYAATLKAAAEATWTAWVQPAAASDTRFWAAAELYRLEQGAGGSTAIASQAKAIVDGTAFGGMYALWTGNDAIYTYIQAPGATASVVASMRQALSAYADSIFALTDPYNSAMTATDYYWSSNEVKVGYGLGLLWAARLGQTGGHTAAQCLSHAEDYLHYLNGTNPMNMTYMTNAAALGAAHGVWRVYHMWFGDYGDTAFSRPNFIGKPSAVVDPLYPYYAGTDNFGISDTASSMYGPPPGIVPDGPTYQYNGVSSPPLLADGGLPPYAKAYRDWNYSDPTGSQTVPWIVNETGIYYISSYTILSSAFVSGLDGGSALPDGGSSAGSDGGTTAAPDAGSGKGGEGGGCGCASGGGWALLPLLLVLARRRVRSGSS